jgi:hypothetical protein
MVRFTYSVYRDRFIEGTIDGEMGSAHHRFPLSPLLSIKSPLCDSRKHFSPSLYAWMSCALPGNPLNLIYPCKSDQILRQTLPRRHVHLNVDQSKLEIGWNCIGFNDYRQ